MNLGIDLGSDRIVIYEPDRGVVLDEPSVIAVSKRDGHIVACGEEASRMLGRTPPTIEAMHPVQNGVIVSYEMTEKMLRYFLHKVCSNRIAKPCTAVSIAENLTEVERRSFIEAVYSAGARRVTLVPETVAAAIGAGLDVTVPRGQLVVNIGAGTTDVAVLSLRGTAVSESIRCGGATMDEDIVRYVRARYSLVISRSTAAAAKEAIGSVFPLDEPLYYEVKGRDALSGLPRSQRISSDEISEAVQETIREMGDLLQRVLEITPPELAGDIINDGLWLTGGVAKMQGITELFHRLTGVPCTVADDPALCVAIGAGKALKYTSSFSEIYDLGEFSYRLSDSVTE